MFLHPFASRATKLFCTFAATKNKTDERGFYQTSPLGADSRRYRSLRAVDYPERGTAGVVSYVVGWCAVLYRTFPAEEAAETSCPRCTAYRLGGIVAGGTLAVFYGSIKASNVSIGVVCLSLMSFFTALFDPLINRHRVSASEIVFSLIGVAGIVLIFISIPVIGRVFSWEWCRRHWLLCLPSATRKWHRVIRRALLCSMKWEGALPG